MSSIFNRTPAQDANRHNNSLAGDDRIRRWKTARDAAWAVIGPLALDGARVAIVGAGNAHDIPLGRIASVVASVDLLDIDGNAAHAAVRRQAAGARERISAIELDVTSGAADAIVHGALKGRMRSIPDVLPTPIGTGSYDLVIGDLFYSQLLFPGLKRMRVDDATRRMVLATRGPGLTEQVVRRLHRSVAPGGTVIHLHDIACWTPGYEQPLPIEDVLDDPELHAPSLHQPTGCDPEEPLARAGIEIAGRHWWQWPFTPTTTYLVRATVAREATGIIASEE